MIRALGKRLGFGVAFSVVAVLLAVTVTSIWGPIYDVWDWPVVAGILLILGAMAFALLEEAVRPQNPFRHLNPLYGLQDVANTGKLHSGGSGWMWNAAPPVVTAVVLVVAF
jgi:hypothetical protein